MENRNYRVRGNIGTDKLLIVILAAAILMIILAFIFKVDILSFFNLLPSFDDSQNGNNTYIPPDENKRSEAIIKCEKIGEIRTFERASWWQSREQYIYLNSQRTKLYWDENEIKLKSGRILDLFKDPVVGNTKKNVETGLDTISIYSGFIDNGEQSPDYKKYREDLTPLTYDSLRSLNKAYLIPGNIICREITL